MTIGFAEPEYTKVHGAVPVNVTVKLLELPEQIVAVPVNVADGAGFTMTAFDKLEMQLFDAVTFNSTLQVPEEAYVCAADELVEVQVSPKSQFKAVMDVPVAGVLTSVKLNEFPDKH